MGRKHTRFDEGKQLNLWNVKGRKRYNDIPKYKYFKVDIPYPEKFNKFTNDEDSRLYRCIYEVWLQGFEDGINQN